MNHNTQTTSESRRGTRDPAQEGSTRVLPTHQVAERDVPGPGLAKKSNKNCQEIRKQKRMSLVSFNFFSFCHIFYGNPD